MATKSCLEPGCDRQVACRGYCKKHYGYARVREGWAGTCSEPGCDRNAYARGVCAKHYEKFRDPTKRRRSWIRARYNISVEQYEAMLIAQGYRCAIDGCELENRDERGEYLCVDHDHSCCPGDRSCGRCVRALLCSRHNMNVGIVEHMDMPALLKYLAKYGKGNA